MNNLSVMLRVKLSVKVQRWPTCYSCSECHPDSRWRLALSFFKDLLSGISFCDGLINCELLYTTLLPISLYRREKCSLTSISSDSVLIFKRHEGFKPPHHIFNLKSIVQSQKQESSFLFTGCSVFAWREWTNQSHGSFASSPPFAFNVLWREREREREREALSPSYSRRFVPLCSLLCFLLFLFSSLSRNPPTEWQLSRSIVVLLLFACIVFIQH